MLEYPFLLLVDTTEVGSGSHEALLDSGVSSQGLLMFQLIPPLMCYSPNTALFHTNNAPPRHRPFVSTPEGTE